MPHVSKNANFSEKGIKNARLATLPCNTRIVGGKGGGGGGGGASNTAARLPSTQQQQKTAIESEVPNSQTSHPLCALLVYKI